MNKPGAPKLVIRDEGRDRKDDTWLQFAAPCRVLSTSRHDEVLAVLERVENAVENDGLHAAGFVSYEAAPAFDAALSTRPPGDLPLAWFGLFERVERLSRLPDSGATPSIDEPWESSVDPIEYGRAVAEIRNAIARGETYQANFTYRLRRPFSGNPWDLFCHLVEAQPVGYAAYVDIGHHALCSASPELFFRLDQSSVVCRPMKGTIGRGLTSAADRELALELYNSRKDRAENLMIVDMVRNDLGRIADPGSVEVMSLFDLETYSSVHQLTSEVHATTRRPVAEVFAALFPCASITGAPKIRTMEILTELEATPRGIYTGAIGWVSPSRRAQFNVAIRTVHIDRRLESAEYGTGAGIVWDSDADEEYAECATKAAVLALERPRFVLFETLRWDPGVGFFLLQRHLDRLERSADYFGFPFIRRRAEEALREASSMLEDRAHRMRLTLDRLGEIRVSGTKPFEKNRRPWRLALAAGPVPKQEVLLYHKTTARSVYDTAREAAPDFDDVLLWNEDMRLTESTLANLVIESEGSKITPPVENGLLAGTFREELIARGEIEVGEIDIRDVSRARAIWLVNSVREWIPVDSVDDLRPHAPRALWRNPGSPDPVLS